MAVAPSNHGQRPPYQSTSGARRVAGGRCGGGAPIGARSTGGGVRSGADAPERREHADDVGALRLVGDEQQVGASERGEHAAPERREARIAGHEQRALDERRRIAVDDERAAGGRRRASSAASSARPCGQTTASWPYDACPCGSGKKYKKCHGANA